MTLGELPPVRLYLPPDQFLDAFADEINHLTDAHEDADCRGDHHEEGKDPLLSGTRYVAVHCVGTWWQGALGQARHVVAFIHIVQDVEEASIKACLEDQTHL